jgi:hypothetical protein
VVEVVAVMMVVAVVVAVVVVKVTVKFQLDTFQYLGYPSITWLAANKISFMSVLAYIDVCPQ